MKNLLRTLFVPIASLLILFGAGGCYTQLGTARNEAPVDEGADEQYTEYTGNEVEGEEPYYEDDDGYDYGNDWENQYRFGFNYYYPNTYWPSVTFAMIYADPWSAAYSYDPWYYRSYSGYYFPWYGYGYGYANYYSPWYGYGYGYGYGHYSYNPGYYYQNVAPIPRTTRNFGSTRASGGSRGSDPNGYSRGGDLPGSTSGSAVTRDMPTATGRVVTGGTSGGGAAPAVGSTDGTTRSSGSVRSGSRGTSTTNSTGRSTRGSGSTSRDNSRIYRDRGSVSASPGSRTTSGKSPAVRNDGKKSTSTSTPASQGTSRRTRSTAPARTSSPRPSSPPPAVRSASPSPSGGSGSQSSGTSRGGSTRNPKP